MYLPNCVHWVITAMQYIINIITFDCPVDEELYREKLSWLGDLWVQLSRRGIKQELKHYQWRGGIGRKGIGSVYIVGAGLYNKEEF